MKRREFTKLAVTAALTSPLLVQGAVPKKKPNISRILFRTLHL